MNVSLSSSSSSADVSSAMVVVVACESVRWAKDLRPCPTTVELREMKL